MINYDWSRFARTININASADDIYKAWTVPDMLEKWFLRKALSFHNKKQQPGNVAMFEGCTYEWYWHGYSDEVVEKGKIVHANGLNKLQFSFTAGALVTVDIGDMAGENIVMLTQENIPTDEHGRSKYHIECQTGWTFFLTNLKAYLEHGIDLRNKNMALPNLLNT